MTKTIHILAVLVTLFFVTANARNKKHCEKCRKTFQCSTGKCWNKRCVFKDNLEESMRECFKPLCGECKTKRDCATELCLKKVCVVKSTSECDKPTTDGPIKPTGNECKVCHEDRKCKDGRKCWNNRCVHDTDEAKKRCFKPTCSKCKLDRDCLSQDCDAGYCVTRENKCSKSTKGVVAEKEKFKGFVVECGDCKVDGDCILAKCFHGTCAKGWRSKIRCGFLHNCEPCTKDSVCAAGKCRNGLCGRNTDNCTPF